MMREKITYHPLQQLLLKILFLTGGMNPDQIVTIPNGYDDNVFNLDPVDPYPGIDPERYKYYFY